MLILYIEPKLLLVKDIVTIDIVYLLSCLELIHCLCGECSHEMLVAGLTAEKLLKLETVVGFFYDCYQQWNLSNSSIIGTNRGSDSILEECANILLDVLKEIGIKFTTNHFNTFSRDVSYTETKEKLEDYVELLESK